MKKNEKFKIDNNEYIIMSKIGEGGNSCVYKVENNNQEFALKLLKIEDLTQDKVNRFKNEQKFCLENKNKNTINVISYGDIFKEEKMYYALLPLYKSNLKEYLNNNLNLEINEKLLIIKNIINGVIFFHEKKVIHRDLKPENILMNNLEDVVIADFGIAHFKDKENYVDNKTDKKSRMCNFNYASPEQKNKNNDWVSFESDIFSLGLMINEIFTKNIINGIDYYKIENKYKELKYIDYIVENMIKYEKSERWDIVKVKEEFNKFLDILNNVEKGYKKELILEFKEYANVKNNYYTQKHVLLTDQKILIKTNEKEVLNKKLDDFNEEFAEIINVYNYCSGIEFCVVEKKDDLNFKIILLVHYGANTNAIEIYQVKNGEFLNRNLAKNILFTKYKPIIYSKENIEGLFMDVYYLEEDKQIKEIYYLYNEDVFFIKKIIEDIYEEPKRLY